VLRAYRPFAKPSGPGATPAAGRAGAGLADLRRAHEMIGLGKWCCLAALVLGAILQSAAAKPSGKSNHQVMQDRDRSAIRSGQRAPGRSETGNAEGVARANGHAAAAARKHNDTRISIVPSLPARSPYAGQARVRPLRPGVGIKPERPPARHVVQVPVRNAIGLAVPPAVPPKRVSGIVAAGQKAQGVESRPFGAVSTPRGFGSVLPARAGAIGNTAPNPRGTATVQPGAAGKSVGAINGTSMKARR
jgi:hypothetical protein